MVVVATIFHLLVVIFIHAAAFQASVPCNSKYRGGVIWKYSQDNVDGSLTPTDDVAVVDLSAEDVVTACMDAMLQNDVPWLNHGLETCFDFSSDRCRASLGGNLDDFITFASNPTFGSMTNANKYDIVNVGPIIAGTPTRGSMQTVLVKVTPAKGGDRQFLW